MKNQLWQLTLLSRERKKSIFFRVKYFFKITLEYVSHVFYSNCNYPQPGGL